MSSIYCEKRPWGKFEVLADADNHKVKRITVNPQARLSLQRHKFRQEHWFIIAGQALVSVEAETFTKTSGQAIDIPLLAKHRVENTGNTDLVFIEIQTGSSFDENDIERFADDYKRL